MNNTFERQMKERLHTAEIASPDYEAMWSRIQRQLEEERVVRSSSSGNQTWRKRLIAAAIAASFLIVFPVMAHYSFGSLENSWDGLWSGKSTTAAINNGLGNRLDLTKTSGGIPFTLHGVVADDKHMNILFTMDTPDMPEYDAVDFGKAELIDGTGKTEQPRAQFKSDRTNHQLVGLFEADNNLKDKSSSYRLHIRNLRFYKQRNIPLALDPTADSLNKGVIPGAKGFTQLKIVELTRQGSVLTVGYEIAAVEGNPLLDYAGLTLAAGSESIAGKVQSRLLFPKEDGIVRLACQSTFDISDSLLKQARFELSVLEQSGERKGAWDFSFQADKKRAEETIYSTKLKLKENAGDLSMQLTRMIITPLEIRILIEQDQDGEAQASWTSIGYEKAALVVGGKEITGRYDVTEDHQHLFLRFESPEWYRDWSKVPMKLILSNRHVIVQAPEQHYIHLTSPSAAKQTIETTLHRFPVTIAYYKEDKDLIVETSSSDPLFEGITMTRIDTAADRLVAEPDITPLVPGTNKNIERYVDIPAGDYQLDLYSYRWHEPDKSIEIPIH